MGECPKCGGDMSKPRYCDGRYCYMAHRDAPMGEHLVYSCQTCGYQSYSKTRDHKEGNRGT